jgi:hypothetical protein
MANKVGDDHRDDDGERGGKNDSQNSDPHASCGIIKVSNVAEVPLSFEAVSFR